MHSARIGVLLGFLSLSLGCQGPAPTRGDDGHAPPLSRVVRVFEKGTGAELSLGAMLDALAKADVVFCGETHLDDVTHRVEFAMYDGLLARRGGSVVLAMEMFTTQAQPVLDDYVAGRIDEQTFRARSNPWGNYDTGYRPMVERARAVGAPVVGSNAPGMLARKISSQGAAAWAALTADERALLPETLLPNSTAYWERFDRTTRGHAGMGGGLDPDKVLYSTQSLWDNTMGWSCARASTRWPGYLVLHVNGGFHTAHGDGTAAQCQQRRPDARIVTVAIETTSDLAAVEFDPAQADADYVVFATARARGLDDGMHAVTSHREQRYRLRVPTGSDARVPLLIWLPGDGLSSEDSIAMWTAAVGTAAVAVLEPQFGQVEADLHRGGRWFFADTFEKDVAAASSTIEEIREYVARFWPIDPARVVVAGEGTGATVAVAAALWGDGPHQQVVAFEPRGHRKFAEQGVPESPVRVARLSVHAPTADAGFWDQEFAAHRHRGLVATIAAEADVVATVRGALGLPDGAAASAAPLRLVAPATASVLGRQWQRTAAAVAGGGGASVVLVGTDDAGASDGARVLLVAGEMPAVEAEQAARGARVFTPAEVAAAGLPPAPGPFGGTTILVVPAAASTAVRDEWRKVATQNPMQRHGRFFRLELAFEDEAPTLPQVLDGMVAARRRNALVVPARFCAEAAVMQELARSAEAFEGQVDLAWLPGLGGRLAGAVMH